MDNNAKGALAEEFIARLCKDAFVADFCFKNPYGPDGKEICDVLIKVGDVALIWQIKSLKLRTKDGLFKASEIGKAVSQCRGARKQLKAFMELSLTNVEGAEKKVNFAEIKSYYLIAAIEGGLQLVGDYYDDAKPGNVHIFYDSFTRIAIKHLNTINDFTDYLRAKETLFQNTSVVLSGGEENLLAYYLKNARTFGELEKASFVFFDDDEHWTRLESHEDFKAKLSADKWSRGWDELIRKKREALGANGEAPSDKFLAAMTRHTRLERRLLGRMFFDAAVEASKGQGDNFVYRRYVPCQNVTYVFGFMGDQGTPWHLRQNMMKAACIVARKRLPVNDMVIGIVTEKNMVQLPTCSYDWVLMDINDKDFEENLSDVAEELASKLQMFQDPEVAVTSSKEYPNQED